MKKMIILITAILFAADIAYAAKATYKVREEVVPKVETIEVKKYYADIYIDGNNLVSGIEVASEKEAKAVCEAYMASYNAANKKSYPTTVNIKVEK